jgi:hypothetical protein
VRKWLEKREEKDIVLNLEPCSSFRRRLLYQEFRAQYKNFPIIFLTVRFPELHVDSIVVPGKTESKMIRITIMAAEERQKIAIEKLAVVKVLIKTFSVLL